MFDAILKDLNENGGGVRAYDICARDARTRIGDEPANAAALLLIAFAAQRFVEAYDDQPLTVEVAGKEFDEFSAIVNELDKAYTAGTAEAKLGALNTVAARLAAPPRG